MNQSSPTGAPRRTQAIEPPDIGGGNKRNLILGIIGGLALILLVGSILQAIRSSSNNGPVPTHIENRFIDLDQDGDVDFIQRADVLFNCGGHYCAQAKPPASQATPASQAGVPTPQVYFPESALEPDPN